MIHDETTAVMLLRNVLIKSPASNDAPPTSLRRAISDFQTTMVGYHVIDSWTDRTEISNLGRTAAGQQEKPSDHMNRDHQTLSFKPVYDGASPRPPTVPLHSTTAEKRVTPHSARSRKARLPQLWITAGDLPNWS
ncbi:hypothetical protein POX_c03890 [Penicillium oxalicum]|uniref:Uncharacterized protein n=1 Tax=Penicillium oxalicum (strain 114-2 / CGMCC 5302) TaxID=933388 RepID=S8AIE2_PENO1|nr:hypothetical protein POX_c03890 [Penicillium oxalicum]EPS25508.1 hypothetical protein PDE_00441 [Penicillium oxalicum 114-2]KAI2791035.1 hypothetical protein POX_c03890 [Penicillium oxalicum]